MQIQRKFDRFFGWIFSHYLAAEFSGKNLSLEKIPEFRDFAKIEMHFLAEFFVNKATEYNK